MGRYRRVLAGSNYPHDDLDRLWKTVLLHQFHDILPGTSIGWVHREAEAAYARVAAELEDIVGAATGVLAGGEGVESWVFNAGPCDRAEVVTGPGGELAFAVGAGRWRGRLTPSPAAPVTVSGRVIDNGLVRVELDEAGQLSSVRDLSADREVLAPGVCGNVLRLHTDLPNAWDAWDIDAHYRRSIRPAERR